MFDLYNYVRGLTGTRDGKDYDASADKYKGMSKKERRELRIREFASREGYRNYSGKKHSYFMVVLIESIAGIIGVAFFALMFFAFTIGMWGLIQADILIGTIVCTVVYSYLLWRGFRPLIKRIAFVSKLRRVCKKNRFKLHIYGSPIRHLRYFSNRADFAVEAGGELYEGMFVPAPRKVMMLRFEREGEVKIVTRYIKSRIKFILGVREYVRVRKYGFEASKNAKKILLLSPAPRDLYYFDLHDKAVVPGDTGVSFFGYTAYSASGFIGHILREHAGR